MIAVALAAAGYLVVSLTADKAPVPRAVVEVRRAGEDPVVARGRTGADGRGPALELPAGVYDVEVHTKTLPFAVVENVVVRAGDSFPLAIALDTLANRYLPGEKLPAVNGKVLDARNRPVAGALVAGWIQTIHFGAPTKPARIHTAADGTFRFAVIPENVTVEARHGGEADRGRACRRYECAPRTVLRLRPDLPPPAKGEPDVFAWTAPPSYLISAGTHLHVRVTGAGQDGDFVLALLPVARREPIPVRAIAQAAVGGKCIDCAPSRGLPWQRFRFHGSEVDLDGVPDEPLDVRVESPVGSAETRIETGARDVVLTVAGGATIRGLARYAQNGQTAEGRACLSDQLIGDELRCVSFSDGKFEIKGVAAGVRRLTVFSSETHPYVHEVEVREGEVVDVGDVELSSKNR